MPRTCAGGGGPLHDSSASTTGTAAVLTVTVAVVRYLWPPDHGPSQVRDHRSPQVRWHQEQLLLSRTAARPQSSHTAHDPFHLPLTLTAGSSPPEVADAAEELFVSSCVVCVSTGSAPCGRGAQHVGATHGIDVVGAIPVVTSSLASPGL